ncbi:MAG: LPXTG cell wall anchor domain-containing protein [Bacteroidales bacterium]|nr:LPXTG cell wall anchor domain-containing protein [Bacteroidales bacterium]
MIQIFYKSNGQMMVSCSEADFSNITRDNVLWIDLLSPTGDEKRAAELFLNCSLQARSKAEEIESSSRFIETEDGIFANTNFILPGPDDYSMEAVSFVLIGNTLSTIREITLKSFTDLQRRVEAFPKQFANGFQVFLALLEQRVDLDADMIEVMSKEIAQLSHKISQGEEDINEDILLDINQMQENSMLVRENIVDKQRMVSSMLKTTKVPKALQPRLNTLLKDIASLINHTNFNFERLEYLQDTVLGLVNLDQNKIMKVFTFISLLLMPPTLIASFYGMNVRLPILAAENHWDWIIIVGLMLVSVAIVYLIFKKKKLF